ncbi:uncharacterized protein NPIL_330591 [Nephila pilipes]|uniref:Uncharacterized protein n=1 Tax=Nephila pilipes TaxID=299642 RepID=A0A8X6THF2_NEPPI|nr:uncharacterized protein NPIL_330591 [Nephila pilipes]
METLIPITVASGRRQIHECKQRNHCISPKPQCGVGSQVTSSLKHSVHEEILDTDVGEERIISKSCKFSWPSQSPDLTPADFGLWGYLKSRVYRYCPSNLSQLKDVIRGELSCIQPDILHSVVARFVTRLQCLIPCGGGHVEHVLL